MGTPVLLNSAGRPEPSPEISRRLAAITPRLSLRWLEGIGPTWAVCLAWAEGDRRWQWVQSGKTDPGRAFDIIGYLPRDCSLDQAPAYLERMLRDYPRDEVRHMTAAVARWNEHDAGRAEVEQAIAEVLDSPDPTREVPKKRGRPRKER